MSTIAAVIGYIFLICILIGSCWPGMNFHVYLLSDEKILDVYKEKVLQMEKRIELKRARGAE